MKKKATSSSSDGISFQSLPEAKAFVDHFFDELLDLYTSGYKASQIYAGYFVPADISKKEKDDRLKSRKKLQDKASDDLHSLGQHLLKMCASVPLLDPFGESREFFELIADQVDLWLNQQPSSLGYWDLRTRAESERKRIIQGLPGYLAYLQTKATTKPKKNRDAKAIDKEKDLLYLLDQYESWQAKEAEKTGRKRFNAKEWLQEYDQWKSKAKAIWGKHVKTKSRDGTSQEVDPSSKIAQGRIDSIIKYAQKIKRERSERGK